MTRVSPSPEATIRTFLVALLSVTVLHAQDLPEGLSTSDWTSIRAAYEAGRHQVFAVEDGHRARTPGQQWTVDFDGRGVAVQPDSGAWSWGLELAAYGFANCEHTVAQPQFVQVDGQRMTYRFDSILEEWYVNDISGLEHGYTLHERPAGEGTLTFDLRVRGNLKPVIQNSGRDVVFQLDSVTRLAYTELHVFDAEGRSLPARFSTHAHGLLLSVDERGASYPLTVDPVAQHAYLKASNTDQSDLFGSALSVSGDTVVVGAYHEASSSIGINGNQTDNSATFAGAAYVFVRRGAHWTQEAYLKASNTQVGDVFGYSVAVSGDTIVVGAYEEDSRATGVHGDQSDNGAANSGAAYVFVRSGSSWSQQAYLKASNTEAGDYFGYSVAVSGDTVMVGAPREDSYTVGINGSGSNNGAPNAGAVYIFVRSGSSWSQQAYVKASNTDQFDNLGIAVAVCGDTAVIGAYLEDSSATGANGNQNDNAATNAGAAYVFVRSGIAWNQHAYLKASNTDQYDFFGYSVSVGHNTVVVGAYGEDSSATGVNGMQNDNQTVDSGAAYVFVRTGTAWIQTAYLKASNTSAEDHFGFAVGVSDDVLIVGALQERSSASGVDGIQSDNSARNAGAAYLFARVGTTWTQQAYLKASNTDAGDRFGAAVAIFGDIAVVGAYGEGSSALISGQTLIGSPFENRSGFAGSAYVFDLRNGSIGSIPRVTQQSYLKASNTDAGDSFGQSIAVYGDTVVVGAYFEDSNATSINGDQANNGATRAGAAYVFVRDGGSWSQQAYLKSSNANSYDYFGYSVAIAGDTIVVGAYGEDSTATGSNGNQASNALTRAGAAYVFFRIGTWWHQEAYLKASNTNSLDLFGWSVAVSGDTIIVGARGESSSAFGVNGFEFDNSATDAGAAYVFARQSGLWSQQAYLKASNTDAGDHFGSSVSISGDMAVVGAFGESSSASLVNGFQFDNSAVASGAAYVFERTSGAWSQQAYLKASNANANDYFGGSVSVLGDTVVVGAYGEDSNANGINGNQLNNSAAEAGAAYVFARQGMAWSQQAYLKASNTGAGDHFGYSVAVTNDAVLVGAMLEDSSALGVNGNQADNGAADSGAAYLFRRCGTTWTQRNYLKASNTDAGDSFGAAVALSGDLLAVSAISESSNAIGVNGTQANNSLPSSGATYTYSMAQLRPSLWPLNAPRIGQNFTLAIDHLDPTLNVALLVVGLTQFPLPGLDLGFLGMPCADLYQSLDLVLSLPPGAGGSATMTFPAIAGLPGSTVYCQAMCLDPSANALGLTITNQITITLVP